MHNRIVFNYLALIRTLEIVVGVCRPRVKSNIDATILQSNAHEGLSELVGFFSIHGKAKEIDHVLLCVHRKEP